MVGHKQIHTVAAATKCLKFAALEEKEKSILFRRARGEYEYVHRYPPVKGNMGLVHIREREIVRLTTAQQHKQQARQSLIKLPPPRRRRGALVCSCVCWDSSEGACEGMTSER